MPQLNMKHPLICRGPPPRYAAVRCLNTLNFAFSKSLTLLPPPAGVFQRGEELVSSFLNPVPRSHFQVKVGSYLREGTLIPLEAMVPLSGGGTSHS